MTATFQHSDGDIREVLLTMFHAPEFWDPRYYRAKFKPPLRYMVSALRATGIQPSDWKPVQQAISGMGEPLYRCLTPNGYPNTNEHWLNSDALLKRIGISRKVVQNMDGNLSVASLEETLGNDFSNNTRHAIQNAPPKLQPILLLSSPEFLYY